MMDWVLLALTSFVVTWGLLATSNYFGRKAARVIPQARLLGSRPWRRRKQLSVVERKVAPEPKPEPDDYCASYSKRCPCYATCWKRRRIYRDQRRREFHVRGCEAEAACVTETDAAAALAAAIEDSVTLVAAIKDNVELSATTLRNTKRD